MRNINAHCILGYRRKMSEIIQLLRYENNERLGNECFSDQNDHWKSSLSKNRPNCVIIGSFSINDVAVFGCVIDKQYDSLSDLIISFGTAKNQIFFTDVSIGTQNILIIFICTSTFTKYGSLYSKYVHNMRQSTMDTGHSWAVCVWGGMQRYIRQPGYIAGLIYGPRGLRYIGFPLYYHL